VNVAKQMLFNFVEEKRKQKPASQLGKKLLLNRATHSKKPKKTPVREESNVTIDGTICLIV
jgi:hypothetical protein